MQEYYEEQLDVTKNRITELEKEIVILQENLYNTIEQLKETQRFLIKLAHSQSEIAKRLSSWPFITVKSKNGEDNA